MVLVIGISGATRCGKGELSRNLKETLEREGHTVTVVGQDRFDTNVHVVKLPSGCHPDAAYEYTDSIDFDRFVDAVSVACGCGEYRIVIVEGFRAFHESGRLVGGKVGLTEAMQVRVWLEISKETCHKRRMATTSVPEALFNQTLWPCHANYKAEVLANVSNGVTRPFVEISGELTTSQILEQAMAHIAPLLLSNGDAAAGPSQTSTFGITALTKAAIAAKDDAIKTVQQKRTSLNITFTALMNYCTAVAVGCKDCVGIEFGSLKVKGMKAFAVEKCAQIKTIASKPDVNVTALSAASGAVTMGAGGGLLGMTAGAGVGAAAGVVPALFTFGLSIPVGALLGGTCGLCAGTAVGGSAGLVGGGAVGYGYEHRDEIKGAAKGVSDKANTYAAALTNRVLASKEYVTSFVSVSRGSKKKAP